MTYYIAQRKGDWPTDDSLAIAPTFHQLKDKIENLHLPTHKDIEILQTRDCKILARFSLI